MGFVRLSRALKEQRKITLDTAFIFEYMPAAPESYTKVYLTGLAFSAGEDNELDEIALKLDMERQAVMDAFQYWQQRELVNFVKEPPSVEYLPVIPLSKQVPKFEKEKYKSFNDQLHVLIKDRPILTNEYNEYYTIMELTGMEVEAMLTIVGYCIRKKGADVGYRYITAVARDLADQGYRTYERVQERLSEFELYDADLKGVLKALKLRRNPDHDDRRLLSKWKKEFGFSQETIIGVAKNVLKGDIRMLDTLLTRYYDHRLSGLKEIEAFNQNRDALYALAKSLVKTLGQRYDSYDQIIEIYITPWLNMGFSEDALKLMAESCALLPGYYDRTMENMNKKFIKPYFKQGLTSAESIRGFLADSLKADEVLKERLGLNRAVCDHDRECYKTWTENWKMPPELISYAASLAQGTDNPIRYMNRVLSVWRDKNITTAEAAKALQLKPEKNADYAVAAHEKNANTVKRTLTAEDLNAMFERLSDDDL